MHSKYRYNFKKASQLKSSISTSIISNGKMNITGLAHDSYVPSSPCRFWSLLCNISFVLYFLLDYNLCGGNGLNSINWFRWPCYRVKYYLQVGFQNVAVSRVDRVARVTGFSHEKMYGHVVMTKQTGNDEMTVRRWVHCN